MGHLSWNHILGLMTSIGQHLLLGRFNRSMCPISTSTTLIKTMLTIKSGRTLRLSKKVRLNYEEIVCSNFSKGTTLIKAMSSLSISQSLRNKALRNRSCFQGLPRWLHRVKLRMKDPWVPSRCNMLSVKVLAAVMKSILTKTFEYFI